MCCISFVYLRGVDFFQSCHKFYWHRFFNSPGNHWPVEPQEQRLRELFNEVKHEAKAAKKIANIFPGGFSSTAIQRKLKERNLIIPKKRANAMQVLVLSTFKLKIFGAQISLRIVM